MKNTRSFAVTPLFLIMGCAAPAAVSEDAADVGAVGDEGSTAQVTQALVSPEYESAADSVRLWNTDLGFCWMTAISGNLLPLSGDFELGRGAFLNVREGAWYLDTQEVTARARCAQFSDFKFAGTGKMVSSPEGWAASGLGTKVPLWGSSTLCFMSGAGNGFDGGAQRMSVTRDGSQWTLGTTGATVNAWGTWGLERSVVAARGHAMCVDTGRTTEWRATSYAWAQDAPQRWMMKSNEGVCMLTGIGGKFAGGGEGVEIAEDSGYWVLRGHSMQHGVSATAQCIPYGQLVLTRPIKLGGIGG